MRESLVAQAQEKRLELLNVLEQFNVMDPVDVITALQHEEICVAVAAYMDTQKALLRLPVDVQ
jgi:hypothetical protein